MYTSSPTLSPPSLSLFVPLPLLFLLPLPFTLPFHTEPPGSPSNLQITAQGPQTITISWEVPAVTNGGISNYTVECVRLSTGTLDFNRTGERTTSITVFDLLPNTTYTCSVVALNPFGESQPATDQITTLARDSKYLAVLV